jgi:hypothetical protein
MFYLWFMDPYAHWVRFGQVCIIKTNFPEADFWLQRRGTEENVGRPHLEFSPYDIGIKVERTDLFVPKFLYYVFMHVHQLGFFRHLCEGPLQLKHIRVEDIRMMPIP